MSARATGATALRVLQTLRRDPRTVGLLLGVPCVLLTILRYVYDSQAAVFQGIGVPLLGLFPLISMFLVTSITMLRERTTGTLERLMTMPIAKLDLLAGYALAFATMAAVQAALVCTVAYRLLGVQSRGSVWLVVAVAIVNALLGMALGLLVSAFARTEFQAVQFLPATVFPQFLLCGLLAPRAAMAGALQALARFLPMTYAYDALDRVRGGATLDSTVSADLAAVLAFGAVALCLGAATLPRRTD